MLMLKSCGPKTLEYDEVAEIAEIYCTVFQFDENFTVSKKKTWNKTASNIFIGSVVCISFRSTSLHEIPFQEIG